MISTLFQVQAQL